MLRMKDENRIEIVRRQALEVLRTLDEHGANGSGLLWWTIVNDAVIEQCHEIVAGDVPFMRDEYAIGLAYLDTVGRIAMIQNGWN